MQVIRADSPLTRLQTVSGAGTGGLAGAEPLQLFGWGARNVFLSPRNSSNRGLLRSTDTKLTSRTASQKQPHMCCFLSYAQEPEGGSGGSLPQLWGVLTRRSPQTVSPNRVVTF